MTKYPVQPRLSPDETGYVCDVCDRQWKFGDKPNCLACEAAFQGGHFLIWHPISDYRKSYDPQKVIAWGRIKVWPRQPSEDLQRPAAYWTDWKDWTFVWTGIVWKLGTCPDHMDVLEYEITHWAERLPEPPNWSAAGAIKGIPR